MEIMEEFEEHMQENGFNPDSEEDCDEYCDWLDSYIINLKGEN
jgi:hypothetical protein